SGDDWYVAAINAEESPLIADVELPGLKVGKEISMYSDNKNLEGSLKTVKADKKCRVKLNVPQNGATLLKY
ncbi:MAG: glycoside hydrolase family 97 C-terminal domain-containing protein, partial [Muribaculaceae bacterium]|nr:glycoside hydrolase family 97 C-terminal domain-containing protein [Muribaculaceae bacterium]